jgi:hypothetical protein
VLQSGDRIDMIEADGGYGGPRKRESSEANLRQGVFTREAAKCD